MKLAYCGEVLIRPDVGRLILFAFGSALCLFNGRYRLPWGQYLYMGVSVV